MKFKFKILIISLVLVVLTVGAVSAAENASDVKTTVDSDTSAVSHDDMAVESIESNEDNVDTFSNGGELSTSENNILKAGIVHEFNGTTFSELQSEINNASENDIIILNQDIIQDGNSEISITKSLTIDGNGHTMDADGKSRIIYGYKYYQPCTIILKNISFINGKTQSDSMSSKNSGGAIHIAVKTSCVILNCNFTNNIAYHNDMGSYSGVPNGGAVYLGGPSDSLAFISNCVFTDNSAISPTKISYSGAMALYVAANISNCIFINNSAGSGGAIDFSRNSNISNCIFINNSARVSGGALYAGTNQINVDSCNFINNTADSGNAICFRTTAGTLSNSYFENNGAVDCYIDSSKFQVSNITYSYNHLNIIVLDNSTSTIGLSKSELLTATIKDDDGIIRVPVGKFYFVLPNGTKIAASIDNFGKCSASYTFNDLGVYSISAIFDGFDNTTVYNGSVEVKMGDFGRLQQLVNNATSGGVIDLTRNYTYDANLDGNPIIINKNITINGNGYFIDGDGKTTIFKITDGANVVLNNINFKSAGSYAVQMTNSNVNLTNCNFIGSRGSYDISSTGGSLYLNNNALSKMIQISQTKILSKTTVTVLENSTTLAGWGKSKQITATILDDKNNKIIGSGILNFVLNNGTTFTATGSTTSNGGYVYGSYTFTQTGTYQISVNSEYITNATVYKGSVEVKMGEFGLLQQIINEAPAGSIITLDRDYTYNPDLDNQITINKNLTINGNGHVLNGAGRSTIVYISNGANVVLNNINFKNAGSYGVQIYNANVNITNCNVKGSSDSYDIYASGSSTNLYLDNNTCSKSICIYSAKVLSKTTISVLNNKTIYAGPNISKQITAYIYDDNNNKIVGSSLLTFVLNDGTTFSASSNSNDYVYGSRTFTQTGIYHISARPGTYLTNVNAIYKGTVEVKMGEFGLLQELINNATAGSVITLNRDYTYNPDLDSRITIDKNLIINGNGHILDGVGKTTIFYISNNANVVLNNINFKNANSYGVQISSANVNITNCNFINTTGSYDIYASSSNLYLDKNTVSKVIYISSTKVLSKTIIVVLENSTQIACINNSRQITATIFDDNNNKIVGNNLITFVLNDGTTVNANNYNTNLKYVYGSYTFKEFGIYSVSATSTYLTNYTLYTGRLNVTTTEWMLLKQLIENAPEGGVINLTRDYTAIFGADSGIEIDKKLTINGNGHILNANDMQSTMFYLETNGIVLNNITFSNGASTVINLYGSNCQINYCNFINNTGSDVIYISDSNSIVNHCNFINSMVDYVIRYSYGSSNVTVGYCNFINTTSRYSSQSAYDIYISDGSLYLEGNKLSTLINVWYASISSPTKIIILNNSTVYNQKGNISNIYAIITDDNNNIIRFEYEFNLDFVLENAEEISASADNNAVWRGKYLFADYGDYLIKATYTDNKLMDATLYSGIISIKEQTDFDISTLPIIYGENATFTINITENARGKIILSVGENNYTIILSDNVKGLFKYNVSGLTPGDYIVKAKYDGDNMYAPATSNTTLKVNKAEFTLIVDIDEGNASVATKINVTAPSDFDGSISVKIGNAVYPLVFAQDKWVADVSLSHGDYTALISAGNSSRYNNASESRNIHISDTPNLKVNFTSIEYGDVLKINITLPGDATGSVTVKINSTDYSKDLTNGFAIVEIANLNAGNHEATVIYNGDSNYNKITKIISIDVDKKPTPVEEINITDLGNTTAGNATLVVSVPKNMTGNITVTVDGKNYTAPITNGTASVDLSNQTPGNYSATVTYSGDVNNDPVSKNITITIAKATLDLQITVSEGNDTTPTVVDIAVPVDFDGKITLKVNNVTQTVSITAGKGSVSVNLTYGDYVAYVSAVNSTKYDDLTTTKAINIPDTRTPLNPDDIFNVPKNISDNPSFNFTGPANASGTFYVIVDNVVYKEVPVINGTSSTVNVADLAPGNHTIVLKYSGDKNYQSRNKTINMTVPVPVIKLEGADVNVLYSATGVYKVRVLSDGKNIKDGENVTITFNGAKQVLKTSKGYVTLPLKTTLKVGTYIITVNYANKTITNKLVIKNIINAKKLKKLKKSKKVNKVKVSLAKVDGKFLKGKKLTLKLKGKKVATAKTNKLVIKNIINAKKLKKLKKSKKVNKVKVSLAKVDGKFLKGKKLVLKLKGKKVATAKTNKKGVATFKVKKKKLKKFKKGKKVKATVSFGNDIVSKKIKIV